MSGMVIVGTGTAGTTAAVELRTSGYEGPVTLVGAEPHVPYRRTALTKDLLAADLDPDRIALQKPDSWAERRIDLVTGVRVTGVDPGARTVSTDDGREFAYDALLLATGGYAVRPDWMSSPVPTIRGLSDAVAVRDRIGAARRVTVVGGGLIGLEVAASAAAHGYDVDVVEAGDRLLARSVPPVVSDWFRELHERKGVRFHFGARVTDATADRVLLADGTHLAGPVVAAVGMRPDCCLAAQAGARTGPAGVLVDATLATELPGVFAAGDAAAVPHPLTGEPSPGGHWFGATDQGRAAAASMIAAVTGATPEPFREVPRAWTVQYGVNVQTVGWPEFGDRVEVDGSLAAGDATVEMTVDGRLVGAVTVGRAAAARGCRARIEAGLGSTV